MDRARVATAALVAVGVGFIVGFAWGRGTRDGFGAATNVELEGSTVIVRTNLGQALRSGLENLLR